MKFELYTLVDITRTNARKGDDPVEYKQQQNYLTVLNTIGLRVNPTVEKYPIITDKHPKFGSRYKGKHTVWNLSFDIEYEDATSVELLKEDFNLVPFIDISSKFQDAVFVTDDKKDANIVFVKIE